MNNFFFQKDAIYIFLSIGVFLSRPFTNHRTAGERRRTFLCLLTTTSNRFTNDLTSWEPVVSSSKALTTNLCALKIEYLTWNNIDVSSILLKSYCHMMYQAWNGTGDLLIIQTSLKLFKFQKYFLLNLCFPTWIGQRRIAKKY